MGALSTIGNAIGGIVQGAGNALGGIAQGAGRFAGGFGEGFVEDLGAEANERAFQRDMTMLAKISPSSDAYPQMVMTLAPKWGSKRMVQALQGLQQATQFKAQPTPVEQSQLAYWNQRGGAGSMTPKEEGQLNVQRGRALMQSTTEGSPEWQKGMDLLLGNKPQDATQTPGVGREASDWRTGERIDEQGLRTGQIRPGFPGRPGAALSQIPPEVLINSFRGGSPGPVGQGGPSALASMPVTPPAPAMGAPAMGAPALTQIPPAGRTVNPARSPGFGAGPAAFMKIMGEQAPSVPDLAQTIPDMMDFAEQQGGVTPRNVNQVVQSQTATRKTLATADKAIQKYMKSPDYTAISTKTGKQLRATDLSGPMKELLAQQDSAGQQELLAMIHEFGEKALLAAAPENQRTPGR